MLKRMLASLWLLVSFAMPVTADPNAAARDIPPVDEAPVGGDFHLRSRHGSVALADFRGKVVLLYFGYTQCPDVCPTSLAIMTQVLNGLNGDELTRVQGLFISVDPERDDLERLDEYADYFHSSLLGITGTPAQVAEVAARYGARYYRVELEGSAFGYAVNHSSVIYLVSSAGVLRFIFPHATPAPVILEATRYLLSQP